VIRTEINELNRQKDDIASKIKSIQEQCPHKTSVYSAHGSTGNWDKDDYYWYSFYCYDCQKQWSHEQSEGRGKSLRVDKINYDEKPEIIELKIKIEEIKR